MTQYEANLRPSSDGMGLTIAYDDAMTQRLYDVARRRIAEQREYMVPGTTTVAFHLSDVNSCLRKARWRRDELQHRWDTTGTIEGGDALPADKIVPFARGYAMQEFFIGSEFKEVAQWSDEYKLIYSPDGGADTPLEFKTSVSYPLVKKDIEEDFSIEDVLMHGGTRDGYYSKSVLDWKRYILQTMRLHGWTHYYLSVVFMNAGEWLTFRYDATPERIEQEWRESEAEQRIKLLHGEEIPDVDWRISDNECMECPFFGACASELPFTREI